MRQELPSTSYALLGLLSFGPELTGYELKQWADASLRFYWTSPAMSQIYTELARLRELGLVTAAGTAPGRRHAISASGRAELRRWLSTAEVDFPVLKHSVALRLFLGHVAGQQRTRELLEEYVDRLAARRVELSAVQESLAGQDAFRFPSLVAEWGLRYYELEAEIVAELAARLA